MYLSHCDFEILVHKISNKTEASSVLFQYLNLKINYFQNILFSELEVIII